MACRMSFTRFDNLGRFLSRERESTMIQVAGSGNKEVTHAPPGHGAPPNFPHRMSNPNAMMNPGQGNAMPGQMPFPMDGSFPPDFPRKISASSWLDGAFTLLTRDIYLSDSNANGPDGNVSRDARTTAVFYGKWKLANGRTTSTTCRSGSTRSWSAWSPSSRAATARPSPRPSSTTRATPARSLEKLRTRSVYMCKYTVISNKHL